MAVLRGAPRLDVHQIDLAFLRPAKHASRGELRAVVRAQVLRHSAFFDQPIQGSCHTPAVQTGIGLQRQSLAGARIGNPGNRDFDLTP